MTDLNTYLLHLRIDHAHDDCGSTHSIEYMVRGGQRVCTVLVYLCTADGGATTFPRLTPPLSVQPTKGRALIFFPGYTDGRVEPQMRHAAEPAGDRKWVAQLWVRAHPDPLRPLGSRAFERGFLPVWKRVLEELHALPSWA